MAIRTKARTSKIWIQNRTVLAFEKKIGLFISKHFWGVLTPIFDCGKASPQGPNTCRAISLYLVPIFSRTTRRVFRVKGNTAPCVLFVSKATWCRLYYPAHHLALHLVYYLAAHLAPNIFKKTEPFSLFSSYILYAEKTSPLSPRRNRSRLQSCRATIPNVLS